jgi:type IV/VI secretion system ImpK/VasF family protein
VVEEHVAPVADADDMWDVPAVASFAPAATPTLQPSDFDGVWSVSEEGVVTPTFEVNPLEEPPPTPPEPEPEKKGFFARLFGKKEKAEAPVFEREIAVEGVSAVAPADADFADLPESIAPADADFADDIAATTTVPAADDFADDFSEAPAGSSPALDHSAEDAANLAALLGPITPAARDEAEVAALEATQAIDETPLVEEAPVEEVFVESAVVEDTIDVTLTIDPVPDPELAAEVRPAPLPEIDVNQKPGFFSGLLKRVSRSMFVPKVAEEVRTAEMRAAGSPPFVAGAPQGDTGVASAPQGDTGVASAPQGDIGGDTEREEEQVLRAVSHEERGDERAQDAKAAQDDGDDLGETLAAPMPAVPMPAVPRPDPEFEETKAFPAFRDARDDFDAEEQGRKTEEVAVPVLDDGEKTDEFEVVPPPVFDSAIATAETRQVAGFIGRMFGKQVEEKRAAAAAADPDSAEAPTIAPVDDKTPFVLAKFRTFYNEVIRDKTQRADVISGFATAVIGGGAAGTESDPEFAAQLLSKRLSEMLELQAAESNWTGGDAAKYYPEAQYAMVALADETFATIDWPGRASWHKYMLEPRMYGTRGADIELFKRIDKLLKTQPQDKGARDLARLYLMVIASGYRGKFRVPNLRRPLAEYRRRLYEYSHQADPLQLYGRDRRMFPQAVEHTLECRAVGRFTSAQKWVATVLILTILYVGISHYAWGRLSADLKDIMSRIQPAAAASSTSNSP